jgi:ubiquinone/menaquinone biosynthesis C-methylase UbiE
MTTNIKIEQVRDFWESNPLCAKENPHPLGSKEYFGYFDGLREALEPGPFAGRLYEFSGFSGKKVLDVGSGNGWVLSRYAKAGADVTGVDLTPAGIELCRKRFSVEGLQGRFEVANGEQLPFPDGSFDLVTCMGVAHHSPHPDAIVNEIYRVLKPGGRLIMMLYHRDSVLVRFKFPILSKLTGKSVQQLLNEVDGVGNPKGEAYSREQMRTLLRRFEINEMFPNLVQGWMVFPKLGALIPDAWVAPLGRKWGFFLYAKGTKPADGPRG